MASRGLMALRAFQKDYSQLRRIGAQASTYQPSRTISTDSTRNKEKRFVRIGGVSWYASGEDMKNFLKRNDVDIPENVDNMSLTEFDGKPLPIIVQMQSDVFQNQASWLYDAGSAEEAANVSSKLAGKVVGMKLARAAAVDTGVVYNVLGTPSPQKRRHNSLRKRMAVIEPSIEERGRTLLCTNLEPNLNPKLVWGFFGSFDVMDVRMLRRSGVASVVFRTKDEAIRAIRERSNVAFQNRARVQLKIFE